MEIQVIEKEGIVFMSISGELDMYNVSVFREEIDKIIQTHKSHAIVNLSRLSYIDSSGISALFNGMRALQNLKGDLQLIQVPDSIHKALTMMRLSGYFQFFEDENEAVLYFQNEKKKKP